MSLTTCLKRAGKNLNAEDKNAILEAARANRKAGMSADEAAKAAVRARLEEVQALLAAEGEAQVSTWTDGAPAPAAPRTLKERAEAMAAKPDKAEIRPFRRADGSIGYEAVSIAPTPSANTIFTEDAAAAARARLKAKLGRLQSGLDPETLMDGITLAGYHVEKGARTFAAYARAMVADMGDSVKPYLQQWYMALRADPKAAELKASMDKASSIEDLTAADIDALLAQPEAVADGPSLNTAAGRSQIARAVADRLVGGDGFATILEARKFITRLTGEKIEAGTQAAKRADETIENAVVLAGRDIVQAARKQGRDDRTIFDRLLSLYKRQPNLSVRSSTSVREQAYSTPVPLAFIASRLAKITPSSRVGEPTAGNSMLLIEVDQKNAVTNELNDERADNLRELGFAPTQNNAATTPLAPAKSLDAEVMNPPFGAVKDADGETIYYDVLPGYRTREVDHAIAFEALKALKDDGNAVLIVGGIDATDPEQIREGYRGQNKRLFYYHLYQQYRVVDHFTVDGDLYSRQGAGYPVDVIVIQGGRGKAIRELPAADLPQRLTTWDQVKEKLNASYPVVSAERGADASSGVAATGRRDGARLVDGPERQGDQSRDATQQPRSGDAAGGARNGADRAGQPIGSGADSRATQPRPANRNDAGRDGAGQPVPGQGVRADDGRRSRTQADRSGDVVGSGNLDGQRLNAGLSDRRGQEQETATQVAYKPASGAASVGTLVPAAMRDAIQDSLVRVRDQVGDIDAYVAKALGYTKPQLKAAFSAEQVDALALAVNNAEQGSGFIIGDQTGIGKGRVVAGMIRYALNRGQVPIFVTEKPNLYADMIRDLDDIGMAEQLALESGKPAIFITNGTEKIPFTLQRKSGDDIIESNFDLKAPATGTALDMLMNRLAGEGSLGPYKVIFTTYNQLQTVKGKATARMNFVQRFGDGGYMIFDESHNAGGNNSEQARTKEQRAAQKSGLTTVTGRASFVRGLVAKSKGSFFSSATYAKRPDVMDLYSSTNMMQAVAKPADLAPAIKLGGVPMQQIVATMLTQDGQYIRRERTFAGVSYETRPMPVDRKTAENMASSMRQILAFSREKEGAVKALQKEYDKAGAKVGIEGEATQVQGANFGAIMHNLIDQMLLALKAQNSVDFAIERLKAGEKVVLTVSNTMGSFLKDFSEEMGIRTGEPVTLSFKDLYLRYLEKQRWIRVKSPSGPAEAVRLTDEQLGPRLVAKFQGIQGFIENSGFGAAPISPIDYMHAELRKAGFKTDEITGRTIALDYQSGIPKLASRQASIKQRLTAIKGFNGGTIDALILNQSGSTGLSLHASAKVKDQRPRRMVIVQAEKNIDTHMQMLGRVHRTGQVVTPAYTQAMAEIPAETRPAAVLLKKMASLNANTTASRKSAVTADGVVDFMNDYGGQVAQEYLMDNNDIHQAIGGSKVLPLSENPAEEATEDDIRKLTGYIPILPIETQEKVYADLIRRYNELIERENAMGTNKLEARALDLDAKTLSAETITPRKKGTSRFAEPASMERVDVKRIVKPMTSAEVRQTAEDALKGKTAAQWASDQLDDARQRMEAYRQERLDQLRALEADAPRIQAETDQINMQWGQVSAILRTYEIGQPVSLLDKDQASTQGVITSIVDTRSTKNPVALSSWKMTIALANGDARSVTLGFSQLGKNFTLRVASEGYAFDPRRGEVVSMPVFEMFDIGANIARDKRWMVTGNILAGFAQHRGQIITYTKEDGTQAQGVLMPRSFNFEKEKGKSRAVFSTVDQARQFFQQAGRNATLGTRDVNLRIVSTGYGQFDFLAPSSKREGGAYFLDQQLIAALGSDFYKAGPAMRARVDEAEAYRAIDYLLAERDDVKLIALSSQAVANKVLGIGQPAQGDQPALSRAPFRGGFVSPRTLRDEVAKITAEWNQDLADVEVVNRVEDLPADILQAVRNVGSENTVRGLAMPDGRVFLVAENISSLDEGRFVLFHEVYGHVGMQAFLGDGYATQMRVLRTANPALAREADAWLDRYGEDEIAARVKAGFSEAKARAMVEALAVEEALADRAGTLPELKGWKLVMAALQRGLRRLGLGSVADMLEGMTEAETLALLVQARRTVQAGQRMRGAEMAPAMSRRRFSSLRGMRPTASYVDATPRQQATLDAIDDGPDSTDYDLIPAKEDINRAADAAFTDWEQERGIKYVPISMLGPLTGYNNSKDTARIRQLADSIKASNEFEPIFVGIDPSGQAFIMEGQHRTRALALLGDTHVPAQVIVDMSGTEADYDAQPDEPPVVPTDFRAVPGQGALFSRRRDFLLGMAAAAAPGVSSAGVTVGRAKPVSEALFKQQMPADIAKALRGNGSKTTNLEGAKVVREVLDKIVATGPAELRGLARQIRNIAPSNGLMLTVDDTGLWNAHGAVTWGIGGPHLKLFTAEGRTGLTYGTFLHEMLHVGVLARYQTLSTGILRENDKVLGLSAPAAAKEMEQFRALYEEFRAEGWKHKAKDDDTGLSVREAMSSPDEFFVRALTDGRFQEFMAGIEYRGKSMLERFKDWVKSALFGLSREGTAPSWLDAALLASNELATAMTRDPDDFNRMRAISRVNSQRSALFSRRTDAQNRAKALGLPATGTAEQIARLVGIAESNPSMWTREDFNLIAPHLSVHQDLRADPEGRIDTILSEGLTSGMVDNVGNMARGDTWTWSRGLMGKPAYVFISGALKYQSSGNPRLAPGNKPLFAITPEKGQGFYEALQTARVAPGALPAFSRRTSQDILNAGGGVQDFSRYGATKQDRIRGVTDKAREFWLGAFTRDQIADVYGNDVPQVREYDRLVRSMENERSSLAQRADDLYQRWAKLDAATNDKLGRIMLDATTEQVHPDSDDAPADKTKVQIHAKLRAQFKMLPPEVQTMYREVRDFHAGVLDDIKTALVGRIERQVAAGAERAALLSKVQQQFDQYLEGGPYFPLSRFGDYLVIATRPDGERVVAAYENSGEQQAAARELRKDGFTTKLKTAKEYARSQDGNAGKFIGDVIQAVEKVDMAEATLNGSRTDLKNQLLDDLNQLFIRSLPDLSYRKHFAHRKNTPGFSADVMRGFASSAFHAASYIARLNHADRMTMNLQSAYEAIDNAATGDFNTQTQVLNELSKRHEAMLNPNTHPLSALATQVGFVMYLGLSPAAGLINMLQVPMVTIPYLGARYGFGKASAAMSKAYADIMKAPPNVQSAFNAAQSLALSADERRAISTLQDEGVIDLTQAHDLAAATDRDVGDLAKNKTAFAMARAMRIVGWTFHVPEVMNRQTTALMAYRLERERGADHETALEQAREAIKRTQFDYSSSNRARYMQGNIARVVLQFKQFSQNMTYFLGRAAHQALKGESPEVRSIARRQILSTFAVTGAMAGSLGLPGIGFVMGLVGALVSAMDDEDEPWDWQTEYRNMLSDAMGKDAAEVFARGVPRALMPGWDISNRVSLNELWWRSNDREGQNPRESFATDMANVLGPTAGTLLGWYVAADHMSRGAYDKAAEAVVPKFIRDPLKAYREGTDGVTSYAGDPLMDVNAWEVLGRSMGFAPSRVSEMYEGRNAVMNTKTALDERRQRLLNRVVKARMDGDTEAESEARTEVAQFNRRNPDFKITNMTIARSLMNRRRNRENTEQGILLPDTKASLRELGRFANIE